MEQPKQVMLSSEQVQKLKEEILSCSLSCESQSLVLGLLDFTLWLQKQLERAKLSIHRLKKCFGISTEKKNSKISQLTQAFAKAVASDCSNDEIVESGAEDFPAVKKSPKRDPNQNHGRYGFADYSGCETVKISHEEFKTGDACPLCEADGQQGKLYAVEPGVLIRLVGQPLITGIRYCVEKFRCTFCGEQYEAKPSEALLNSDKYDSSCRTNLAIGRYWLGLPFKRIELWQGMQGVPVPDATQWDKVKELWGMVKPVYETLVRLSAEGEMIYYDDTPNKILSQQSLEPEGQKKRRGVHTTAMVCRIGGYETYLFFTSVHHAGENITQLLAHRTSEMPLLLMSDASASNRPKGLDEELLARFIICFCLVHGRRKFFEVYDFFDQECDFVLKVLGTVYRNERRCLERGYTASQRLAYHQLRIAPQMEGLRVWLHNKLLFYEVEPNSGLGQAINYMQKNWTELTQFLRVEGAPLDNSVCERAIKVAIRHRKNSLFFKTPKGALVGDGLMSLIHTAARSGVNAVDYLNTLQQYSEQVAISPELWLPWHYERTLQALKETSSSQAA